MARRDSKVAWEEVVEGAVLEDPPVISRAIHSTETHTRPSACSSVMKTPSQTSSVSRGDLLAASNSTSLQDMKQWTLMKTLSTIWAVSEECTGLVWAECLEEWVCSKTSDGDEAKHIRTLLS